MSVYKRGDRWYYYIKIKGVRYRGAIPEARTKYKAQEAEKRRIQTQANTNILWKQEDARY